MKDLFHRHRWDRLDLGGLLIAALYVLAGGLWIKYSDDLAGFIAQNDEEVFKALSFYKGMGYVLVTGILLFLLIHANSRSLKAANRKYLLLAENISDVVWTLDLDAARFTYISPSIQQLRGLTPGEALRETPQQALLPDSWEFISRALPVRIAEFQAGEDKVYVDELGQSRRDGSTVWVEVSSRFVVNAGSGHLEVYAASRDVTARRQTEEALRRSEERFHSVFDNMLEGCQIIGFDWRYLYLNGAAAKHNRRPNGELLGNLYVDMWPGIESTRLFAELERCMEERAASHLENNFVYPDGQMGWFDLSIQPVPEGVFILSIDVTERVLAERQAAQMKRLYAVLSQVNQTIVRVRSREELYQGICDVVVQFGDLAMAWVGLLDEATGEVRPAAANGLDVEHWPFPIVNVRDGPHHNGVVATAVQTARVVTSEDIQGDDRTKNLHAHLQGFDYHSLASVPFRVQGRTLGVLNLISSETGHFSAGAEIQLLEEMGLDISFALDNLESGKIKRQWAAAFEYCAHGISIGLPETNTILTCNPAYARLQGRPIEEISSLPILEMYAPQDREHVGQRMAEADRTGHAQYEVHMLRKDGSMYPVQMDLVSVRDDDGNLLYRVATQQDITERRQAEQILRESEARFSKTFHASPIGIHIFHLADGRSLDVNDAFLEIVGYSRQEFAGRTAAELNLFVDPEARTAWMKKLRAGETVRNQDARIHRKSGEIRDALASLDVIDINGEPMAVVIATDITERKQAERKLEESQRFGQATIDALSTNLCVLDENGIILNVNRSWIEFAEANPPAPADYFVGSSYLDVCDLAAGPDSEGAAEFAAGLRAVLRGEHSLFTQEYPCHTPNGEQRWFNARVTRFMTEGRARLVVTHENISERKLAELAVLESGRQMGALVTSLDDIVFELDEQGTYRNIWTADESLLVLPRAQVLGLRMGDVLGQETSRPFIEAIQRVLAGGLPESIEYPLETMGGQHWFLARISPILTSNEPLSTVSMLIRDITSRRQAEADLKASRDRLAEAQQLAHLGNWEWDLQKQSLFWSEEVYRIFGRNPLEFNPNVQAFEDAIHPEDREDFLRRRARMLAEKQSASIDHRILLPDGRVRHVQERTQVILGPDQTVARVIGTVQDVTERKRAEREIQQRNEDLLLINALNDAANRSEELEAITEVFARETRSIFNSQAAAIYLLSSDGKAIEMQGNILPPSIRERIEKLIGWPIPKIQIPLREDGYFRKVLANEDGLFTSDPLVIQQFIREFTETAFIPPAIRTVLNALIPQIHKSLNIGSMIAVPLLSSGRAIGILDMSSEGLFTAEDLARIRTISRQMTAVILRKQAESQAMTQLARISALNEIERAISSSLDMRLSLDILLSEVRSQLGVDAASILLLNKATQSLDYVAGRGFRSPVARQSRLRLGEGLTGRVGLERKILHVPNLADVDSQFKHAEALKSDEFVEYFGVPLIAKGMLKGVLEIFHRTPLSPDQNWVNYLETLGVQAAIAIDNVQLFDGMQQSNLELITAYDATIAGWSHAMDLRDKETEGHTQRVTDLTLRLAERMGISQAEQVHMRRGALLHDIGKLGVPDHILLKAGPLTDEEWVIMRQHPTYAQDMLMPIIYLRPAMDIPYCHHEKWDGSGYPRRLKDEQIPLSARLFAVVDVWDALRSDRPYRASWSKEKTRDYIREQSGKHFDPRVVEIFLDMIDHG
jgi:PAS domain S-box-containing protein